LELFLDAMDRKGKGRRRIVNRRIKEE